MTKEELQKLIDRSRGQKGDRVEVLESTHDHIYTGKEFTVTVIVNGIVAFANRRSLRTNDPNETEEKMRSETRDELVSNLVTMAVFTAKRTSEKIARRRDEVKKVPKHLEMRILIPSECFTIKEEDENKD